MSNVKYLYLRDPENNDHVLTVARELVGGLVTFAWAVNKCRASSAPLDSLRSIMSKQEFSEMSNRWRKAKGGDQFRKSTGRDLARGRLASGRNVCVIPYRKNQVAFDIVAFLADPAVLAKGYPGVHHAHVIAAVCFPEWCDNQHTD